MTAITPMHMLSAILLIVAPLLIGMVVVVLLPEMNPIVYYIIGYVLLMVADMAILAGIARLPAMPAMMLAFVLPWFQFSLGAIASSLMG